MPRRIALSLAALAVGGAAPAVPAAAQARTAYCSRSGDYCTSIDMRRGARYMQLATFSFRGRYRLCVTAPRGAATCRRFRLRRRGDLFVSEVRWSRHFPDRGRGAYSARWYYGGARLGPALTFRR